MQIEVLGTEDDVQIVQKIRNGALQTVYGNPIGWESMKNRNREKRLGEQILLSSLFCSDVLFDQR